MAVNGTKLVQRVKNVSVMLYYALFYTSWKRRETWNFKEYHKIIFLSKFHG